MTLDEILAMIKTTLEETPPELSADILDSGMTLSYITGLLKQRGPSSIRLCTLLDKPERHLDVCDLQQMQQRVIAPVR